MKTTFVVLSALAIYATSTLAAGSPAFTTKVTGQGRPMILIPGLATPGAVWDATVDQFKDRYTCHVLSLAGFGGTPARIEGGSLIEATRGQLAAYIREQKLDRPVIVGHSLGGFIALDLAARYPDLPGSIVVVDSLPFVLGVMRPGATVDDAKQMAESTAAAFSQMDEATYANMIRNGPNASTMAARADDLDRIIAWGLASDPATVAQAMADMYSSDLREDLSNIKVPTLALAAWIGYSPYTNHEIIKRTYGEQYARLEGVRIEITDTARHFIMFDDLPWMLKQIDSFLGETSAGSN